MDMLYDLAVCFFIWRACAPMLASLLNILSHHGEYIHGLSSDRLMK